MSDGLPIPQSRNLYLPTQVDQESMNKLTKSIIDINESDDLIEKIYAVHDIEYVPKPIKIYIDTYGGLVYQCFGLIGVMEKSDTPIHTIVTGAAMSCGFMILINGHKRFGYKHATPLYHQVSTGFFGNVKEMEESLVEAKRLQEKIEEMTLRKTKIPKKRLKKIFDNKVDWYMSAEEALKLRVIDEII